MRLVTEYAEMGTFNQVPIQRTVYSDDYVQHVEGGLGCRWYKVRMSEELFAQLGLRVEWGEPDAEGFYTPMVVR